MDYKKKAGTFFRGLANHDLPGWLHGRNGSIRIIFAIISIAAIWMATGLFPHKDKAPEQKAQVARVKVEDSFAQDREIILGYNGITEFSREVAIKAEMDGRVAEVVASNGQYMKAGDLIIRLDGRDLQDRVIQAESVLAHQRINYAAAKAIFDKKLSSESAFYDARSKLEGAVAALAKAKDDLRKANIVAPFDGYIDNILVSVGDYISPLLGDKVAQFSDTTGVKAVTYIPQKDIRLVTGSRTAIVQTNGQDILADITFISKIADNNTHAFRLEICFDNTKYNILAGKTVKVRITLPEKPKLHHVAKSSLDLEMDGGVVVKVLEEGNKVRTYNADILDEDDDGFWVAGLPGQASIIVLGHQYVQNGEQVEANTY